MAKINPRQRERIADLLRAGVPVIEAAGRARMSITTARAIGHWLGLLAPRPKKPPKPPRPPKPPKKPQPPKAEGRRHGVASWQYAVALAALRSGATCADAAEHAAIGDRTAARIARENGIAVRPRGSQKGLHRVDPSIKADAIRLRLAGATLREIAHATGASHEAVRHWCVVSGVKPCKRREGKGKTTTSREPVSAPAANARTVEYRGVSLARRA